jgi:hypothetical protein
MHTLYSGLLDSDVVQTYACFGAKERSCLRDTGPVTHSLRRFQRTTQDSRYPTSITHVSGMLSLLHGVTA